MPPCCLACHHSWRHEWPVSGELLLFLDFPLELHGLQPTVPANIAMQGELEGLRGFSVSQPYLCCSTGELPFRTVPKLSVPQRHCWQHTIRPSLPQQGFSWHFSVTFRLWARLCIIPLWINVPGDVQGTHFQTNWPIHHQPLSYSLYGLHMFPFYIQISLYLPFPSICYLHLDPQSSILISVMYPHLSNSGSN